MPCGSKSLTDVMFLHGVCINLVIRALILPILYFILFYFDLLSCSFYLFFSSWLKKKEKEIKIAWRKKKKNSVKRRKEEEEEEEEEER